MYDSCAAASFCPLSCDNPPKSQKFQDHIILDTNICKLSSTELVRIEMVRIVCKFLFMDYSKLLSHIPYIVCEGFKWNLLICVLLTYTYNPHSCFNMIFHNVSSSTSHKKNSETWELWNWEILKLGNSETGKLWKYGIYDFFSLAQSFMNRLW